MEGDILSLSFGFRPTKQYLYDDSLQAKHKLDSNGAGLISLVAKSVDYADLKKQARRLGVNQTELINMLNNLNLVAGLRLDRPFRNLFKWLPEMAAGNMRVSLSMTEPDGGTDVLGAMKMMTP